MLASIVVNNYNYGRFLADAIDSALAQTYTPLEVIVVDDGSTDDSRAVIARYGERVVPVLKANGGQASAFNAGFAVSRGEAVLFLDADDVLLPTALARAIALLGPGVAQVHWPLWEIDTDGARTGGVQPPNVLLHGDLRDLIIREGPAVASTTPTSGNLWARWFLDLVLPMPEDAFRINGDGYLFLLAWVYGRVHALAEPQSLYRIHGDNNFVAKPSGERRQRHFDVFLHRCDVLAAHLRASGVEAEVWKSKHGLYRWVERERTAKEEVAAVVPVGGCFILVDDGAWTAEGGGDDVVPGRRAVPFLERDGVYWGRPGDDSEAVRELARLLAAGADFLVFAWSTFWWLDEYGELAAYLRRTFQCVRATGEVIVFDLRPPPVRPTAADDLAGCLVPAAWKAGRNG